MTDRFLSFADADLTEPVPELGMPWKLAVIDDDEAVHESTAFALKNFRLNGRGIDLISARSAREGLELIRSHADICVVLLDVVMETDDAGLRLARAIRQELRNDIVRIILRTGQPGQAPEHHVVVEYDINDYKAKTELTAERLFTALTSSLRSYEQLRRLDDTRRGLELIVAASSALFDDRSLRTLARGVLLQLNALLAIDCAGILVIRELGDAKHSVLASTGSFAHDNCAALDFEALFASCAGANPTVRRNDPFTVIYVKTAGGSEVLVLLDAADQLTETQTSLVSVFSAKLAVAFDNARLYEELQRANATLEARVAERVTELAEANRRLEAQSALLRKVNAFKNEMMGMIAHDLKNPLAVILGRAEMLSRLATDSGPAARDIMAQAGHVTEAARRMTRIVDTAIADALADAFDIGVECRRADLRDVVGTAVSLNTHLAAAKSQILTSTLQGPLVAVCDPDRIAEALDNLVGNSVKYAPIGGRIVVSAYAEGEWVRITVSDDGPGLKEQDVTRLFGRFQRLSAQPTGGESSTGLGLSIVRRIAEVHGGRVDVEAHGSLGGACFTISLPMAGPPETA